jgi:hypothetical protein
LNVDKRRKSMATEKTREAEYIPEIDDSDIGDVACECGLRLEPRSLDDQERGAGMKCPCEIDGVLGGAENFYSPDGLVRLTKIFPDKGR